MLVGWRERSLSSDAIASPALAANGPLASATALDFTVLLLLAFYWRDRAPFLDPRFKKPLPVKDQRAKARALRVLLDYTKARQ